MSHSHSVLRNHTASAVALLTLCATFAWALSPGDTIYEDTTLTADIIDHAFSGTVLRFGADGITLDGAGHRFDTPNASIVIDSAGHSGVTIKDLNMTGSAASGTGVLVRSGTAIHVLDVDVSGGGAGYGVEVNYSSGVTLERVHA